MNTNMPVPQKDQREKSNLPVEVSNEEKKLWTLFQSRGLLHTDVQNLYRKICCSYENIFLNCHELELGDLQDVEFSLWKMHYKHIDEYRKRIKRNSANGENTAVALKNSNNHVEGFKLFLSHATDFYIRLITKIKTKYGLPEEFLFHKRSAYSVSVEQNEVEKCRFLCYRFNICIGDLARYKEQYGKHNGEERNWSVAAKHYLEASMIWPDSGNPQNQLAVLATYVGEDFLALYHCMRSLAVKEPFPDAWNNLSLLFERNRSSNLPSLLNDTHSNFSKASESISEDSKLQSHGDCSVETTLWPLFIRSMSFFFIESRLEDFSITFEPMMREFDKFMALDDSRLKSMLESYRQMDSSKTGPFRALQVVSIFIFVIQKLVKPPEIKRSMDDIDNTVQQLTLTQIALTATFSFMGQLVHRCSKTNTFDKCPLLPAVLVFVEWLVTMLGEVETYGVDEKSRNAMTYFFSTFVNLLRRLNVSGEVTSSALWEDFELRGFAPLAHVHVLLDSSVQGHIEGFTHGSEVRVQRIVNAALKIANRSEGSRKFIVYDELRRVLRVEEIFEDNVTKPSESGKSVAIEEEEVIVFKPLIRYNSAPFYSTITTKDALFPRLTDTSMLIAENTAPSMANPDFTNFSFKPQESIGKDPYSGIPVSTGPPSLNAWVMDLGNFTNDRERKNCANNDTLSPIEEIASLSINESRNSIDSSEFYSAAVPSAPLLPDNATWFNDVPPSFPGSTFSGQGRDYSDWATNLRPRPFHGMSSSEWLRQYRENLNPLRTISHTRSPYYYDPRNFYGDDDPARWQAGGYPLVNGVDEQRRETFFQHNYERPNPYYGFEAQPEKEKEWHVWRDPNLRGPTYMGS